MSVPRPHFLLFCDGSLPNQAESSHLSHRGRWRFVLENVEGADRLEASDAESNQAPDRLALLAVVRGLEALSQPSRVTLVTTSRYVNRGLHYGLPEWRENDYCWEHFGSLQPIRNADLWQRIDRATKYHSIHCRLMSGDDEGSEEGSSTGPSITSMNLEPLPNREPTLPSFEVPQNPNEIPPPNVSLNSVQDPSGMELFTRQTEYLGLSQSGSLFPNAPHTVRHDPSSPIRRLDSRIWTYLQIWFRTFWRRFSGNRFLLATV